MIFVEKLDFFSICQKACELAFKKCICAVALDWLVHEISKQQCKQMRNLSLAVAGETSVVVHFTSALALQTSFPGAFILVAFRMGKFLLICIPIYSSLVVLKDEQS